MFGPRTHTSLHCLMHEHLPLSTVSVTRRTFAGAIWGNVVSSHEVSPRFLRILASPPPDRAHLPPLTGSLPNGVPPPNGVSFKRYSSWSPLPIGNLEKKKTWGRIWGRSPVALPFSDFLGGRQPSRTATRRTPNTPGVEESSPPRRVLHF